LRQKPKGSLARQVRRQRTVEAAEPTARPVMAQLHKDLERSSVKL
jgi:hypothetical protein